MNERIKELRNQVIAKMPAPKYDAVFYKKHIAPLMNALSHGGNEVLDEFHEKFAELILKECFQYLENEEDRLWDLSEKEEDHIFQSNFEICAEKCRDVRQGLKEHFGVEE